MLRILFFICVAIFTGLLAINVAAAPNGVAALIYGIVYLWALAALTFLYLWAK